MRDSYVIMDGAQTLQIYTAKESPPSRVRKARLSIFEQDFWRDIAGRGSGYREAVVLDHGVAIVRLSYTLTRDSLAGISWALAPPLTCRNGPIFSDSLSDGEKSATLRRLLHHVLRRHPFTSFTFTCDPAAPEAGLIRSEFIRAGFKHLTPINPVRHPDQPSLMTPQASDDPAVNKRRSHINNARGKLEMVPNLDIEEFLAFYDASVRARGKLRNYVDAALARALLQEGLARRQVKLLGTRAKRTSLDQPEPPLDAAIAIAWDEPLPAGDSRPYGASSGGRCYLLLLAYRSPSNHLSEPKPNPDANKVLIMEAADFAVEEGMIFDTGGWATQGAGRFYRQMFPGKRSEEYLDVFKHVKWHAGWYEACKLAFKEAIARRGITQKWGSWEDLRIAWPKLPDWMARPFRRKSPGPPVDAGKRKDSLAGA
jgi:hypothetical protein